MRQTMRPVTLSRVIETCYLSENNKKISDQALVENLGVTRRRAREILLETTRMNFLEECGDYYIPSKSGIEIMKAIRTNDWQVIHNIMMDYPFYSLYYTTILEIGPVTKDEIIQYLITEDSHINKTTIDVIGDWTERIGSVQRNVFNGKYYTISNSDYSILSALLSNYDKLNRTAGISLRQRYIEIPQLRESVCEELKISREEFDKSLLTLYKKNIGILELSGAPETTHAKRSKKKVKSVVFSELPDWISMQLTSDQYLSGIQIEKKKYYYLAIHGRDLK